MFSRRTLLGLAPWLGASCWASSYPDKPIRLVVLFPPGQGIDYYARYVAEHLGAVLGQPVLVENRVGANGLIAVQSVKAAPADGLTVLISSPSPMSIAAAFGRPLPYDPLKDFKPVLGLLRSNGLYLVSGESRVTTFQDLVAWSKSLPVPLTLGTYAEGYHLSSQQLANVAGVRFQNVPYRGAVAMLQDLVGGRIDAGYSDMATAHELVRTGKLRALASTGERRNPLYPEVATLDESAVPGYFFHSWNAFFVRSETPGAVVAKLAESLRNVVANPRFQELLRARGTEPLTDESAVIQRSIALEVETYRALIARNRITANQ